MKAAKQVRKFLKKQHTELLAVKKKHVAAALKTVNKQRPVLAVNLDDWSGDDGKLNPKHARRAKVWALSTAAVLGSSLAKNLRNATADAANLAVDHLAQWSDIAGDLFDADEFADDTDFEVDDDHIDDLQASYVGNTRRGVYASLLKVAKAVAVGAALSDLADTTKADSDDVDDLSDAVFGPIDSRTETYVRTETGDAYGLAMADAAEDKGLQKRWATIDPGCDEICHPADGQVQDMDDDFEMGDGSLVDYPPAHPRCDCEWLPYKEEWGSLSSTDDIEEAA